MVELCHEQPEDPVRRYGFNGLFFFFGAMKQQKP
jgi:hypothetical protein